MIVRTLTRLPVGVPRTWYAPGRTVVAANAVATGVAVAVTGPRGDDGAPGAPGPPGPPGDAPPILDGGNY